MIRLSLADDLPSLLKPARMDLFGVRAVPAGKVRGGKRPYTPVRFVGCGWQGWNADATMEQRMSRLPGSGSFYWPNALRAYQAARKAMQNDQRISQVKLETISGQEIARIYR